MKTFEYATRVGISAEEIFHWHAREGSFERLKPPWEKIAVIHHTGNIKEGELVNLAIKIGPITQQWLLQHRDYIDGEQFKDVQVKGPFLHWEHAHRFEKISDNECNYKDTIYYRLPFGNLGERLFDRFIRNKLERLFKYRHGIVKHDLVVHKKYRSSKNLKFLVVGGTGLIGHSLIPFLKCGGHEVKLLTHTKQQNALYWSPENDSIPKSSLEGFDLVINLAGENISKGRWTAEKKRKIKDSRVESTELLCRTLATLKNPPKLLLNASAIGFYGDRGDEELTEQSPPGNGFLSEVCREWEASTIPAQEVGIRTVLLRFGMVLSGHGGALTAMLTPFMLGLGGITGSGQQWMSWIAIEDVLGSILHIIANENISGPVNIVSPFAVRNETFTQVLGKVINRPTFIPFPAFAARLFLGEMANELLLSSCRVLPGVLKNTHYQFHAPVLEEALKHLIGA